MFRPCSWDRPDNFVRATGILPGTPRNQSFRCQGAALQRWHRRRKYALHRRSEGSDDSGKLVAGGIAAETKAALENIQKVIKAAGFDLKDIVSVTVYLADIHEFGDMNKVYKSFLPEPKASARDYSGCGPGQRRSH